MATAISQHKRKREKAIRMAVVPREFPSIILGHKNKEYFYIYTVQKRKEFLRRQSQ